MTRRIPTLETERLIIRELTMDDLETLNPVLNESTGVDAPREIRERWLQWTVLGYEMFAMLKQPHYGERGITLKNTGELIGAIGIVPYIDSFGQIEAFNSRFRQECLNASWFLSQEDAKSKIEVWRLDYNTVRPHTAIGHMTPVEFAASSGQACLA